MANWKKSKPTKLRARIAEIQEQLGLSVGDRFLDDVRDPSSGRFDAQVAARVIVAEELPTPVLAAIVNRRNKAAA